MRRCDWTTLDGYSQFLEIQHAARLPIEAWAAKHCGVDALPPPQTGLIARDLKCLGRAVPEVSTVFRLPFDADPIGLAWALAGSSLGNQMILREVECAGHSNWPTSFLSDPSMREFWQDLRDTLNQPATHDIARSAIGAALGVFEHFSQCANASIEELAA